MQKNLELANSPPLLGILILSVGFTTFFCFRTCTCRDSFFVRTLGNIKMIISYSSSYGSFSKIRGVGIIKSSSQFQINTLGTRKLIRESQCSRENYSNHKLVFAVQLSKRGFRVQTLLKKEEQKIVWACRNH